MPDGRPCPRRLCHLLTLRDRDEPRETVVAQPAHRRNRGHEPDRPFQASHPVTQRAVPTAEIPLTLDRGTVLLAEPQRVLHPECHLAIAPFCRRWDPACLATRRALRLPQCDAQAQCAASSGAPVSGSTPGPRARPSGRNKGGRGRPSAVAGGRGCFARTCLPVRIASSRARCSSRTHADARGARRLVRASPVVLNTTPRITMTTRSSTNVTPRIRTLPAESSTPPATTPPPRTPPSHRRRRSARARRA